MMFLNIQAALTGNDDVRAALQVSTDEEFRRVDAPLLSSVAPLLSTSGAQLPDEVIARANLSGADILS